MTNNNVDQATEQLYGATVFDQDGDKIGDVAQVYLDDQTGQPTWATVRTGLFGTKETFVPLDTASRQGGELRLPYTKDFVKGAPHIDADHHITPEEEAELFRYYSRDYNNAGYADTTAGNRDGVAYADRDVADRAVADRGVADRDVNRDANRNADGSMVLHEEELHVGKERVATGQMRLRKHVITEQKTVTVPVTREEYTLEREPIRDGEAGTGKLGDDEVVVTQYEERPVVEKDVVATERVGLHKETVTDQEQVSAEVSREEATLEQDGRTTRDRDNRI